MDCSAGLVVFFRIMAEGNQLACSVHLDGRGIRYIGKDGINYDKIVEIWSASGEVIGYYERDFVAAILPLATVGPASANSEK